MHPNNQPTPAHGQTVAQALAREKLIRLPAVEAMTGLKRSSIYAYMRAGNFPGSVRLGVRAVAWRESQVQDWCVARTETRGHQ